MELLMILMAFLPVASAVSMKSLYVDGAADSHGVESSRNSASRADMIDLQKDLAEFAEERSEFKSQTKLLKDIVEEVDELKAQYRSKAASGDASIEGHDPSNSAATASAEDLALRTKIMSQQEATLGSYPNGKLREVADTEVTDGFQISELDRSELEDEEVNDPFLRHAREQFNDPFLQPRHGRKHAQGFIDSPADESFDAHSDEDGDEESVALPLRSDSKKSSKFLEKRKAKKTWKKTGKKTGKKTNTESTLQGALKLFKKKEDEGTIGGAISHAVRVLMQIFFGVMYFLLIVRYYPQLPPNARPPQEAVDIQKMNPVVATFNVSPKIFICSYMCPGPRAAHTYESAGVMNYWMGLICMSCFPCCTLFLTNTVTDLNPRLGGDQMSFVGGCIGAFFCSCCLIAQDAQALDYVSGVETHFFNLMRP